MPGAVPQAAWPAGQVQVPATQVAPVAQRWRQVPQETGLVCRSKQMPPQLVWPAGQVTGVVACGAAGQQGGGEDGAARANRMVVRAWPASITANRHGPVEVRKGGGARPTRAVCWPVPFDLKSDFKPTGDQPRAIGELVAGLRRGDPHQVLLGVTGSGKTFTIANVIAEVKRPALVIAHNKTLAAQLYGEFKELFPDAAVHYFVSYYDYYQPEAYVPSSDTYIEKDSSINDEIDRMRHAATHALLTRNDVIIVASVSCIYGLGTAEAYFGLLQQLERGQEFPRDRFIRSLVDIQYERNDLDFHRGTFRVRGDTIEVFPPYEEARAIRIEFFGDVVERLQEFDPLRGTALAELDKAAIFPNSHYVSAPETRHRAIGGIRAELQERLQALTAANKLVEAQRLEQRTTFDLEMLEQMGFCNGIENYSRWLSGRKAGRAAALPARLLPQGLRHRHRRVAPDGQPRSARCTRATGSRKETLVEYGFRLPSALDNRPLTLRGVREALPADHLRLGHAGRVRAAAAPTAWWWSSSSAPPA